MRSAVVLGAVLFSSIAVADKAPKPKAKPAAAKPEAKPAAPTAEAPPAEDAGSAQAAAPEQELPPHLVGPKQVDLGPSLELALPDGMILYEKATAQELLKQYGDPYETVVGIITKPDATWSVVISNEDVGYVSDHDAAQLDANALLDSLKRGTEAQNKVRETKGVAPLTIDNWTTPPHYEAAKHQLIWGLAAHDKDAKLVNFNTRVLGRSGFVSVNLIDAPENLETAIPQGLAILEATQFKAGSRYADFREGDRESGMSLTGLIVGGTAVVVAKKAGLIALLVLFFKKAGIVIAAGAAGVVKFFRRGKSTPSE